MATLEGVHENRTKNAEKPRGEVAEWVVNIMKSYGKEICFVLAIIFTAYAALHNSPPKTQRAAPPKRFFPSNSLVSDYYLGNIQHAFERISESDVTFVMFYAPWDAVSMDSRWEFEKTARHFYRQIRFLAINCWWPDGECKQHFRRISSYPVLMAYPGTGRGIQYRGPHSMPHMVRFLENMMLPLKPVFSALDLLMLRVKHDTVVLGYFDFQESSQPTPYLSFYTAALRSLEKDLTNSISFAVLSTKEAAKTIGLERMTSPAVLFRFNETIAFPSDEVFRSDTLLKWILEYRQPVVRWLSPPNVKSLVLSSALESSNAALIMFTPQNPLEDGTPYFDLLKEVAMDYYNCDNSSDVQQLIDQSAMLRTIHQMQYKNTEENCKSLDAADSRLESESKWLSTSRDQSLLNMSSCCHSVVVQTKPDLVQVKRHCDICVYKPHHNNSSAAVNSTAHKSACQVLSKISSEPGFFKMVEGLIQSVVDVCKELMFMYNPLDVVVTCCRKVCSSKNNVASIPSYSVTDYDGHDDKMAELIEDFQYHRCKRVTAASQYSILDFPESMPLSDYRLQNNFSGLGCRTNKTLTFVAMDTVQYGIFTRNLGVNLGDYHHRTAVLIHHTKQEVQHLLKQLVTQHNLVEFIQNYTEGDLTRHLRSSKNKDTRCKSDEVCIQEVTTNTFKSVVLDDTKDVILMYYTPWCGFCKSIAHFYLSVAHYFHLLENVIFARINGEENDLAWEFTAEKYPTILFFPAGRKVDSVAFPTELPITTPNLIHFVLVNTGRRNRLQMALNFCLFPCISHNRLRLKSQLQVLQRDAKHLKLRLREALAAGRHRSGDDSLARATTEYQQHLAKKLRHTNVKLHYTKILHFLTLSARSALTEAQKKGILENQLFFNWDLKHHTTLREQYAKSNVEARLDTTLHSS